MRLFSLVIGQSGNYVYVDMIIDHKLVSAGIHTITDLSAEQLVGFAKSVMVTARVLNCPVEYRMSVSSELNQLLTEASEQYDIVFHGYDG